MLSSFQVPFISPLAVLGLGSLFLMSFKVFNYVHIYFLTPSRLSKYLSKTPNDEKPWALVTGASDGIGFETAKLLYARGFNVLMHGRNPEKLTAKAELLRSERPDIKDREIQCVVGSATEAVKSTDIVAEHVKTKLNGGRLRVLVNNVGGSDPNSRAFHYLDEITPEALSSIISLNVDFQALLVRKLLPLMVRPANAPSAEKKDDVPVLILNVGSYAGLNGMPFIATYSAGKSFGMAFSQALSQEMILRNAPVEVLGIIVGEVISNGNKFSKPSFGCITSAEMAKSMLERVGCGIPIVTGNWRQALLVGISQILPRHMVENSIRGELKVLKEREDKMI